MQRAALSHLLQSAAGTDSTPKITSDWIERWRADARLPSPALQAANLIRLIGDEFSRTGDSYVLDEVVDTARVGTLSPQTLGRLCEELTAKGILQAIGRTTVPNRGGGVTGRPVYGLTLEGWERYEAERRGQVAGRYGFIAMPFGVVELDKFVTTALKPIVKKEIGYDVVDMRDVARAGVIDNIMRAQIRDAAFVLADLTHDNAGAYWEAGYAEGLGKPVIYLCEHAKFNKVKPHFDTNHCTTVMWSIDRPEEFGRDLIATLRRSLNLFAP
jgi:hypothetical protein